jgi:hypothetical protein
LHFGLPPEAEGEGLSVVFPANGSHFNALAGWKRGSIRPKVLLPPWLAGRVMGWHGDEQKEQWAKNIELM